MFKKNIYKYIAILVILIFLHYVKILAPIEKIFIIIANPVAERVYLISSKLRMAYNNQFDKRNLQNIIDDYEKSINQLIIENSSIKIAVEENKKLRQHLKFLDENQFNYILANIVSGGMLLNSDDSDKNIIINKGIKSGLHLGSGVLSSKGIIIGKIVEVKDNTSKVSLITGNGCKLAAVIQKNDKTGETTGIAEGELGLTIKMKFISQKENIQLGDVVVTSGLEENIPRGLIIGKVSQVKKDNNEIWQGVTIEPLVNLDELIIVSVILE